MEKIKRKTLARLSPLNCEICKNDKCMYYNMVDELYRLGITIPLTDCAEYNGGKLRESEAVRHE